MKEIKGVGSVPGYAIGNSVKNITEGVDLSRRIVLLDDPDIATVLSLSANRPAGAIIFGYTRFSHLSIYLHSLNIPTVLITDKKNPDIQSDQIILLDGYRGAVIVAPDKNTQRAWNERQIPNQPSYSAGQMCEARTKDGEFITVGASVSSAANAADARRLGADEIGLLRTEFLFPPGSNPLNEEFHFKALQQVCEAATPLPIKVRLFDVGGEKLFDWVPAILDSDKTLGLRGARIYQYEQFSALLQRQLEIISLLSVDYEISVLLPFISSSEEFLLLRKRVEEIIGKHKLYIGAMIETPSMCFSIQELLGIADFIALGTNDLMQCFFGADRGLKTTAQYFEPYSPALFRLLKVVADHSNTYNLPLQVCGQLPLYPYITPLLLGLGFKRFSVEPYVIPTLKGLIQNLEISQLRRDAIKAIELNGAIALKSFLADLHG